MNNEKLSSTPSSAELARQLEMMADDCKADYREPIWRAAALALRSETAATVKYLRYPLLDKRISNGDDYAGDAWVRWTAVGQSPENASQPAARHQAECKHEWPGPGVVPSKRTCACGTIIYRDYEAYCDD